MGAYIDKKHVVIYNHFQELLKNHYSKIIDAPAIEQYALTEQLYSIVKEAALLFYDNGKYSTYYKKLLDKVIECEGIFRGRNITFDGTIFSFHDRNNIHNVDDLLDYVVTKIRVSLIEGYKSHLRKVYKVSNPHVTIDQVELANMCEVVSDEVKKEFDSLGVKCRSVRIDPGFNRKRQLYHGCGYHYFNIVTVKGNNYLMDLTYSQFFNNDCNNMLERLGSPLLSPCHPGVFMLIDDERVKTAEVLLKRGWVPFDEKNIKNYFDGFALSVRNGLYYEDNGLDYHTDYSASDYIKFIEGADDMFNHERREHLGRQIKPLRNPRMRFNIK